MTTPRTLLPLLPLLLFVASAAAQSPFAGPDASTPHSGELLLSTTQSAPAAATPVATLPEAPSVRNWPGVSAATPGTKLLIRTSEALSPHICRLERINPDDLICTGSGAHGDIAYERVYTESIQIAPPSYAALSGIKIASLYAGAGALGLSSLCSFDGGPVCETPAITGISLLATGTVLHFVQLHLKHKDPKFLYVAPGPVARPAPRIFGIPIPPPPGDPHS